MHHEIQYLEQKIALVKNTSIPSQQLLYFGFILFLCSILFWLQISTDAVTDIGDGVMHYLISKNSWHHPRLFMDHWGKPLFTLLSSPFSQFGYTGIVLFNVICFGLTSIISGQIIGKSPIKFLFPVLLLSSPIYIDLTVSGMTEPLFGLLTIWNIQLFLQGKHIWAATVASFLIYARPEAICFLPFFIMYTLKQRKFWVIPYYMSGTFLYMLLGMVVYSDFFWFINQNPYQGASANYGSGSYLHFILNSHYTLGRVMMLLLPISLLMMFFSGTLKNTKNTKFSYLTLMVLPGLSVIVMHSVFWGLGVAGSLGLLRVVANGLPVLVLFTILIIQNRLPKKKVFALIIVSLLMVAPILSWPEIKSSSLLFNEPSQQQKLQEETVKYLEEGSMHEDAPMISAQNPYLWYLLDLEIFGKNENLLKGILDPKHTTLGLPEGALFVWDAQFGPAEMGIPLEMVMENPYFRIIKSFIPKNRVETVGGRNYEIHVFEVVSDTFIYQKLTRTLLSTSHDTVLNGEFPITFLQLIQHNTDYVFKTINVSFEIQHIKGSSDLHLVYSELLNNGGADYYWDFQVKPDENGNFFASFRMLPRSQPKDTRLYFWSPESGSFVIKNLLIIEEITK